jgi:hypothetical protein
MFTKNRYPDDLEREILEFCMIPRTREDDADKITVKTANGKKATVTITVKK